MTIIINMPGSTTRCASRYLFTHSTTAPVYRAGMMIRRYLGQRSWLNVLQYNVPSRRSRCSNNVAAVQQQQHTATHMSTAASPAGLMIGHDSINGHLMTGLVEHARAPPRRLKKLRSGMPLAAPCNVTVWHTWPAAHAAYTCGVGLLADSPGGSGSNAWLLSQTQQHLLRVRPEQ